MSLVFLKIVVLAVLFVTCCDTACILGVFPVPSISHQVVFRQLTYELAKSGHSLVVITPDPAYHTDEIGKNITEIDLHDVSYDLWRKAFVANINGQSNAYDIFKIIFSTITDIVELQLNNEEVKKMIERKEKFDLILIEACARPALIMSHIFKAPVIQVSSLGSLYPNLVDIGAISHPIIYPETFSNRFHNVSMWEKITTIWLEVKIRLHMHGLEEQENNMIKRNLGPDAPSVTELRKNIQMLYLYTYPLWDGNRPVPPGVVYIGGIYKRPDEKLPDDIRTYLDSSRNGVIYMSLGTNVQPSLLPTKIVQVFMKVFSELPYDILLKWDEPEITGKPKNVKLFKWLPQSSLLKHSSIKLFITQGGLQSTEEAILAAIPMIGFPMLADQWYNAEKYVHFKIGLKLDIATVTEDVLKSSIMNLINNVSYRDNIKNIRSVMIDQPQSPAERAVWWIEHLLRHGGAQHLKTGLTEVTWTEYILLDVIVVLLLIVILFLMLTFVIVKYIYTNILKFTYKK